MATITYTTPGPCSCCGATPVACGCALFIPVGNPFPPSSPYASYADALAAISDPLQVAGCVAYFFPESLFTSTSTATVGTNTLTLDQTFSIFSESFMWSSLNLTNGETLSVAWSGTLVNPDPMDQGGFLINVYNCAGTLVHTDFVPGSNSGTFTYSIPADDAYTVLAYFAGNFAGTAGWTHANAVISATTLFPNPVIALWDDSGTTRQLWACPKNIIPRTGLVGTIGSWFASQTDAQNAIDNYTSNCVGYFNSAFSVDSFLAVDGGTSLAFSTSSTGGGSLGAYGGVNAVAGQTLSMAFTGSVGTVTCFFAVLDYTGALIFSNGFGSTSSPVVSSALPYTGQYFVTVVVGTDAGAVPFNATATLTSSGTMSVNPIQALYDVGLDCPATLDCA